MRGPGSGVKSASNGGRAHFEKAPADGGPGRIADGDRRPGAPSRLRDGVVSVVALTVSLAILAVQIVTTFGPIAVALGWLIE